MRLLVARRTVQPTPLLTDQVLAVSDVDVCAILFVTETPQVFACVGGLVADLVGLELSQLAGLDAHPREAQALRVVFGAVPLGLLQLFA